MASSEKRTDIQGATHAVVAPKLTVAAVTVTVAGTSAASAQLAAGTYRMISTTACHVLQGGSAVTATTSSTYLPADVIDYFDVTGDSDDYIAVIQNSAGGTLFLTAL